MVSGRMKIGYAALALLTLSATALFAAHVARAAAPAPSASESERAAVDPIVLLGRQLVISHACGGCHGPTEDGVAQEGWLVGEKSVEQQFLIGPCAVTPGAQPCFHTHPRNLTPDDETGLGRFTERQIFNALRYGVRPEDTPDVKITSTTPGQGNFPLHPHYLAPPMPWPAWRHMKDAELWAIAAYLKRGLKPVHNKVAESEGPPDFWASAYQEMPQLKLGTYPAPPFPTVNERAPDAKATKGAK
jgi:mono/diheme cytochrome c family protein